MHEAFTRLMPIVEKCAKRFSYKRPWLFEEEMIAEAYFILSLIILENYRKIEMTLDEECIKKVKSAIYRELGSYIRHTQKLSFEGKPIQQQTNIKDFDVLVNEDFFSFVELVESLAYNELEIAVFTLWVGGVSEDQDVANILNLKLRKVQDMRRTIVQRYHEKYVSLRGQLTCLTN